MVVRVITERLGAFDGSNVNMIIASGKTVLMYAARGASVEILNRLLELGADPKAADEVSLLCMSCTCLCCSYLAVID